MHTVIVLLLKFLLGLCDNMLSVVVQFFRRLHAAYVDAASNPFHVPGKRITSAIFAERVGNIVKSFGVTAPA